MGRGREVPKRHRLRIRPRPQDHWARKITGGKQSGQFHVGNEERHTLVVARAGAKEYAFARDMDLGADAVFLHQTHAPAGYAFEAGACATAIVVQTPKGLHAQRIRPTS